MTERIVIGGNMSLMNSIDGDINLTAFIDGEAGQFIPLYPEGYSGEYTITPSEEIQVLPMQGLVASRNVTVEAIPKNYGRIAYNGTVLTVY